MVFSWFWIVHVPRTFLDVSSAVAVFEALFVSGLAFVLAGYREREASAGDSAAA
ncbi:MAG TPA: hypothetical protein VLF66_07845 [Thermoanaerobaculia bacterium]|nr:hypothetical protein [Thermoanaerobaculia bacterium]